MSTRQIFFLRWWHHDGEWWIWVSQRNIKVNYCYCCTVVVESNDCNFYFIIIFFNLYIYLFLFYFFLHLTGPYIHDIPYWLKLTIILSCYFLGGDKYNFATFPSASKSQFLKNLLNILFRKKITVTPIKLAKRPQKNQNCKRDVKKS